MSEAPWWLWCLIELAAALHMPVDFLRWRNHEWYRRWTWLD